MPLTYDEAADLMPEFITSCKYFRDVTVPKVAYGCAFGQSEKVANHIFSCRNCPLGRNGE
jgi:hypothetical protein